MIIQVRRASARPWPQKSAGGWLVRQPFWCLALAYWICSVVVAGGSMLAVSIRMHGNIPLFVWPLLLASGAVLAVPGAAQLRTTGRRRSTGGRPADTARGSHERSYLGK